MYKQNQALLYLANLKSNTKTIISLDKQINRALTLTILQQATKVFAKGGLENVTSIMCKHQEQFGPNV